MGTELNNVNNNWKKYMLSQTPLESCDDKKPASLQVFLLKMNKIHQNKKIFHSYKYGSDTFILASYLYIYVFYNFAAK